MFKFILALSLLSTPTFADEWSTADTYRELTFQAVNIVDWGQTRYIAEHPDLYQEKGLQDGGSSLFISAHPTTNGVDSFMLKVSVLHFVVAYFLPSDWRVAFQYITIGAKLDATINNATIGIKVSF